MLVKQYIPIKNLGKIVTGKTPSTKNPENFSRDIMFITPVDLKQGYALRYSNRYISKQGFESIQANTISGISVLVGCIGSDLGNVSIINAKCATNQQINAITNIKKEYDPYYIYYWFCQKKAFLHNIAGNTTTPIINKTDFEDIIIDIPNLHIQNKITNILKALDDKIEQNNKINAELEATARDLYNYWFIQFDFPDEFRRPYKSSGGKMLYNDVLKREIPDGWEVKSIKDFCNVITGKEDANFATTNGIYPFFTCGDEILKCDKSAFEGKAILIAGNGNFNVKYYEGKFNAYQRTYVLIPTEQKYVGIMYRAMLDAVAKFTHGSNGSIVKFITKGDIENTYVIVPNNVNLLDFFNGYLSQVEFIKKQTSDLEEIRDFLLPMLMNGQVSVS